MPTARHGLVAASVNGIVYAIGGGAADGTPLRKVEAYNPATNTWTPKAPLPAARSYLSGAAVINGKIYVAGGLDPQDRERATRTLYVYTPATNRWVRKADVPVAGAAGTAWALNGRLYVFTPKPAPTALGPFLHRYDPATNTWVELTPPPNNHYSPAGSGVINGQLYLAGGLINGFSSAVLYAYDPATDTWNPRAPMPTARYAGASRVLNGKLYVAGGSGNSGYVSTLEVYDPASNSWAPRANMPTARGYLAAGAVNGLLYIVGGWNGSSALNTTEAYTP